MAKVLISFPDELLERVDALVGSNGESRSGFIQRLAEKELSSTNDGKREEIGRLLDEIASLQPGDQAAGISAAQLIREGRESH